MSSLIDALLFDPPKWGPSPLAGDVFIAARGASGAFGSGTLEDPYNGSAISSATNPAQTIQSIARSGLTATAHVPSHGFAVNDRVTISGVDQTFSYNKYANREPHRFYCGTVKITAIGDVDHFSYLMKFEPVNTGDPELTPQAESGTTMTCWKERERFDIVLRDTPARARIWLGPGVFETKGFDLITIDPPHIKSGWHIIGSGIEVTKLKVVNAAMVQNQYSALGNDYSSTDSTLAFLDGFTAEEFSVDCNIGTGAGQQLYDRVATAAFVCAGRDILLRRIRATNFGSRTRVYGENFPFFVINSLLAAADPSKEPVNCVIEDCIAEMIDINTHHNTSIFLCGGGVEKSHVDDSRPGYAQAGGIRNCFANGDYVGPNGPVPSLPVGIQEISDLGGRQFKLVTKTPHFREDARNIQLLGVNMVITEGQVPPPPNVFNNVDPPGIHQIDEIVSPTVLKFTLPAMVPSGVEDWPEEFIGVGWQFLEWFGAELEVERIDVAFSLLSWYGHHGMVGDGGTAMVVEGNKMFNIAQPGPYQDTWSTKDMLVRGNYYYNVFSGPFENRLLENGINRIAGSTLTRAGNIATFTTPTGSAHYMEVGEAVWISGAVVGGSTDNPYNGRFEVKSVPSSTSFTYEMTSDPGASATGSFKFARFWQVRGWTIENNVIELARSVYPYDFFQPGAIGALALLEPPPYTFHQILVRGNVMRTANGFSDPIAAGIGIVGAEMANIEHNVLSGFTRQIGPLTLGPLNSLRSVMVKGFNNRSLSGEFVPIFNRDTNRKQDELADELEDALVLSLF